MKKYAWILALFLLTGCGIGHASGDGLARQALAADDYIKEVNSLVKAIEEDIEQQSFDAAADSIHAVYRIAEPNGFIASHSILMRSMTHYASAIRFSDQGLVEQSREAMDLARGTQNDHYLQFTFDYGGAIK